MANRVRQQERQRRGSPPSMGPWPLSWLDEWQSDWGWHHDEDADDRVVRAVRWFLDLTIVILHPRSWREYSVGDRWGRK